MMTRYVTTTPQVYFSVAFPLKKVRLYFIKEHGRKSFPTRFILANSR
jgi:hypothetical protein